MKIIRVLIADDHAIVREGLRTLIASQENMVVVGEAQDGKIAIERAFQLKPDIILMDLVMPQMNGIEAISNIKKTNPGIKILVITNFSDDDKVFPAIKAGATGYLLKDSSPKQLINAINEVYLGKSSLHPDIAIKLIQELKHPAKLEQGNTPLSPREIDVLKLVAQGMGDQNIAKELTISEWTVRTHMRNILSKLHLANRTQAAIYALSEGLADLKMPKRNT